MFKGLLTPAWQSESLEKRLQAIQKMESQDKANQVILQELANTDSEIDVRQAALSKLNNPEVIWQISQTHSDQTTRQHAQTALANLMGPKSTITETAFRQLITSQKELKLPIAALCPFENIRHELIADLNETEQIKLLDQIEYSQTRQYIAQHLINIEDLELARKQLKGKDKSAEKIIKTKLDHYRAAQQQEQENQDTALAICEKMELLAEHDWDTEFKAKFNIWNQRWKALNFAPKAEITERYTKASDKVAEHVKQVTLIETTSDGQQTLIEKLHQHCLKLAPLSWQALSEQAPETQQLVITTTEQWLKLNKTVAAAPTQEKKFRRFQTALMSLDKLYTIDATQIEELQQTAVQDLGESVKQINWPTELPPLLAKDETQSKHLKLKQALAKQNEESANKLDKLHKRINRLLGSTKRGNLQQAKREIAAITKAAQSYSGKNKIALDERLNTAAEAISKMGDWKDFATEPKYLELCDAMEALLPIKEPTKEPSPKTKIHPDALAAKIVKLQKRWKTLGHSDSADQHWERFKAAADKAYEPCAEFFEQRHATRAKNLEKREPLVQQMQDLLNNTDWDAPPDYKKIEASLQTISREWQKIKEVERDAGQQQWDRLSSIKSKIYAKLDVVYDANLALKTHLIEQAQTMLEIDPTEDTLNKLKLFQSRWKQVGITRRKQDQAAWKQFKAATDAVYEKLQGVRKEKRAEEDAQLAGYRKITRELQSLAKTATNLAQGDTAFEQLQTDYKALPPLPKGLPEKLVIGLDKDFQRACDAYNNARTRITKNVQDKILVVLKEKAALCGELEKASSDEEIVRLNEAIEKLELNDKGLNQRFAQRLKAAQQDDRTEATKDRERLCLDLEILLDIESPDAFKAQRMQVQLERLKTKGIGRQAQNTKERLDELKLDWLCLPGAEPVQQAQLDKRFQTALKK